MVDSAVTSIPTLPKILPQIAEGKVRNLYKIDSNTLLFVATDRISAYDVIMKNGIPSKGILLTLISAHWFKVLPTLPRLQNLRTHFLSLDLPASVPESERAILKNRSMQVRGLEVFKIEAIVRGYITGSAWKEYQSKGTVHGLPMPAGLRQCEEFPQGPIYTPSTKAEAGEHDKNISPAEAADIVGPRNAQRIEELALKLYTAARDYARERGIIIADTKFEFGLDKDADEIVLIDEVLTPDSSRFWPADKYEIGHDQESYDKQYLRNWLTKEGKKEKPDVVMEEDVVKETAKKYQEAFEALTGQKWEDAIRR